MSDRDEETADIGEDVKSSDETPIPESGVETTPGPGLGEQGVEAVDLSAEPEAPPPSESPPPDCDFPVKTFTTPAGKMLSELP